jgi:hypothetical protein
VINSADPTPPGAQCARSEYVTEGVGLVQRRGGPIEIIRPGDRVFLEPGEDHWHGAAPNGFLTRLAMLQADDEGNSATWGEHFTNQEYTAAPPESRTLGKPAPAWRWPETLTIVTERKPAGAAATCLLWTMSESADRSRWRPKAAVTSPRLRFP